MFPIAHFFSTSDFPNISTYGRGWEHWLIAVFVLSRAIALGAYATFAYCFRKFVTLWGQFDPEKAVIHLPRVGKFYLAVVVGQFLLNIVLIMAMWFPANRPIGIATLAANAVLFAGALKTAWAITSCIKVEPEHDAANLGNH